MPFNIGGPEAMFILVIVLIVFGAGRLPEVFGQLGKGIRTFREESANADGPTARTAVTASPSCPSCHSTLPGAAKFCPNCGASV